MASKSTPAPIVVPKNVLLRDDSISDVTIEYREQPGAQLPGVWHVNAEKLCANSNFFASCMSPLRESKDGIISLHGHPGGVNVIGVALHFIYTGECSVSQYTEDPIEGLRLRLHLFKLADFLDMKGPWLHMENLKCFDDEIWEIGFGKQLSSAVSLLYDTENASVPYIQECRKKFCGHFPAMLARKRQITESPDDGFWATFRSNMTFASDVAFELAKSNVQLQRIVGEKCQSADSG